MSYLRASGMRSTHARRRGIGTLDDVLGTITMIENANPELNNPGNLIYAGQPGASASSHSFVGSDGRTYYLAQFDTADDGQAALDRQVQLDASRGLTIAGFTAKYDPAGNGNDPAAYAQSIAQSTGLSVDDPLSLAIGQAGTSATDLLSGLAPANIDFSNIDLSTLMWPAIAAASLVILWLIFD